MAKEDRQLEEKRLQEEKDIGEQRIQEEERISENRRMEESRREEDRRQQERWREAEKRLEEKRNRQKEAETAKSGEKDNTVTFEKNGKEYKLEEPGRVVGQDGMEAYIRNARDVKTGELERDANGKPKEYLVDTKEKKVWEANGTRYHQDADYVAKDKPRQRWQDNEGRTYEVVGERMVNARFNRPDWDKDPIKQTISQEVKGVDR